MQLIITEKPSVAQSIGAVLGVKTKRNGYLEGGDILISWCFGHLAEFAQPDAYDPELKRWRLETLPIFPPKWKYQIGEDKKEQFLLLSELMNRADVDCVINGCDAGREGELIFRNVYRLAKCQKPMKRLWISSMEDSAIRQGFQTLKDGSDYNNLAAAAKCRAQADWLIGMNATRFFSCIYSHKLNVGRVVSPTLALLVQREKEITDFVPIPFYLVRLNCDGGVVLYSERYADKNDAQNVLNACSAVGVVTVKDIEKKEKTERAPALYDLTAMQRDANRLFGYTAEESLNTLQSLYEKKLCTYPRTDARYLTDDMEATVPDTAQTAAVITGLPMPTQIRAKQVCNSAKVSDHHAVIPTAGARNYNVNTLSEQEKNILCLVATQVLKAVSPKFIYEETVIVFDCAGLKFGIKGRTVKDIGWKMYEAKNPQDVILPALNIGDTLNIVNADIDERQTTPPKHYTEDTLLSAMENAGAKEMPDDAERKGLGTPATRAATIEKMVNGGFARREKSGKTVYVLPTQDGNNLIYVLPDTLKTPLMTAEWEYQLKDIEHGRTQPGDFITGIKDLVASMIQTYQKPEQADAFFPAAPKRPSNGEVVGKCPRCGSEVRESSKGFFCAGESCKFALWTDNKFFAAKKKTITKDLAKKFLAGETVTLKDCYSEKKGTTYSANFTMEDDGAQTSFKMEFVSNVIGKCPRCNCEIKEYPASFSCSNRDCGFVLWKENNFFGAYGKKLTESAAKQMLAGKSVLLRGCQTKEGNKLDVRFSLSDDGHKTSFAAEVVSNNTETSSPAS